MILFSDVQNLKIKLFKGSDVNYGDFSGDGCLFKSVLYLYKIFFNNTHNIALFLGDGNNK